LFNNTAYSVGGGIANWATMTVSDCILAGNSAAPRSVGAAAGQGGAIYATSTYYTTNALTVSNCTLSGNSATGQGGGISIGNGAVNVINGSVLSGNSAALGGGIYIYYATLTVSGSTLSSNYASTAGGGIYVLARFPSPVTITGSTFNGNTSGPTNTPDEVCGVYVDGGGNTGL
jgi:parallel beta-helix repeat protein